MSTYLEALTEAMKQLSSIKNTIFIGQAVQYEGTGLYETLTHLPENKKMELPKISIEQNNNNHELLKLIVDTATIRIFSIYKNYTSAVDRFNIGIVPFIAEYYSIIDKHKKRLFWWKANTLSDNLLKLK